MSTAIDTNVIVSLWTGDEKTGLRVEAALRIAVARGGAVICGAVYAELLASRGRTKAFVDEFCAETGIMIDWSVSESVWVAAGSAFQKYSLRRQRSKAGMPRRILADFLIGAHARENGHSLLTLDNSIYKSAFPTLDIVRL